MISTLVEMQFKFLLTNLRIGSLYLPSYTCSLTIHKIAYDLNIKTVYYHIDRNLKIKFDPDLLGENDIILLNNYFGILTYIYMRL